MSSSRSFHVPTHRRWRRQAAFFLIAGGIAFFIDAGIVQALVSLAGWDPVAARAVSWACAVTFTFAFNRSITFQAAGNRGLLAAWVTYVGSQSAGLAGNLLIYVTLVHVHPWFATYPACAVAAGASLGAVINFVLAKQVVFRA